MNKNKPSQAATGHVAKTTKGASAKKPTMRALPSNALPHGSSEGGSSATSNHRTDGQDVTARPTQRPAATSRKLGYGRSTSSSTTHGTGRKSTHDSPHDTHGQISAGLSHSVAGTSPQRTEGRSSRKPSSINPKPPSSSVTSLRTGPNQETGKHSGVSRTSAPKAHPAKKPIAEAGAGEKNPNRATAGNPSNDAEPSPDQSTSERNLQERYVSPRLGSKETSRKSAGDDDKTNPRVGSSKTSKKPAGKVTGSSRTPGQTPTHDANIIQVKSPSRMTDLDSIRASDSSIGTEASTSTSDSYVTLGFLADMFTDAETQRIATANRLRVLTDEREHGHGLSPLLPEIAVVESVLQQQVAIEHELELTLKRAMKKHPLGPWVASRIGLGEKQVARFLGSVGDPADRPSIKQLNAYCGMDVRDGAAPHRKKGEKSNWKEEARSRLRLLAESCIKQDRSPYRPVYDMGRVKYADAVHGVECPQCGVCKNCGKPPGRPFAPCCDKRDPVHAPVGSALRDGHKHARALRLVAKRILEDLYNEAVRVRDEGVRT